MRVAVFVVGCVLAVLSGLGLGVCVVLAWLLQHPPSDIPAYNPPEASSTALGLVLFLVITLLLGAIANLLIGIGTYGMGARRER